EQQKNAVKCGYVPIFGYNPNDDKFTLDFKNPNFDDLGTFLNSEKRFAMLKSINEGEADTLLRGLKEDIMKRFDYYKSLEQ
ncbi:MAG: hypothetical protein PHW90_02525, partial [Bacilli bacterium]|nr:hypothetical protein [Bacilli bacterium]